MNIREHIEKKEGIFLSKFATLAKNTRGRKVFEEESELRTAFQRDRDRIIHSKAFRRLKHKTQVFIAPEQDHYRTRLTHTLEVSQIARTIARALALNEDLVEAIALGHDLGHTPFGHSGEEVLNKIHPGGFKHYEQSVRVVEFIEQRSKGSGLNLTWEVLDGIRNHSGENIAATEEGKVIKYADRIAYINHDIDDALRAHVIRMEDIPEDLLEILGFTHSERINTMITDLVYNSLEIEEVSMSREVEDAMMKLRGFMFENVYLNPEVKDDEVKIELIITDLYKYYLDDINRLPSQHLAIYDSKKTLREEMVCDYIAGMTDTYIEKVWDGIFGNNIYRTE